MSTPYLGQISIFSFSFAPKGWALANGQLLPINQNQALFSILGTTYGGNGTSTFGLPNLQGANPVGAGSGAGLSVYVPGEFGGLSSVNLITATSPNHNHPARAVAGSGQSSIPGGNLWAQARAGRAG